MADVRVARRRLNSLAFSLSAQGIPQDDSNNNSPEMLEADADLVAASAAARAVRLGITHEKAMRDLSKHRKPGCTAAAVCAAAAGVAARTRTEEAGGGDGDIEEGRESLL